MRLVEAFPPHVARWVKPATRHWVNVVDHPTWASAFGVVVCRAWLPVFEFGSRTRNAVNFGYRACG